MGHCLTFTRYCFTSSRVCTSQSSFQYSGPPALPTLLQYYCTAIGQYTTPPSTSLLYAIHHTILVITISCKGQATAPIAFARVRRKCSPFRRSGLCTGRLTGIYIHIPAYIYIYNIYTCMYIYIYIHMCVCVYICV